MKKFDRDKWIDGRIKKLIRFFKLKNTGNHIFYPMMDIYECPYLGKDDFFAFHDEMIVIVGKGFAINKLLGNRLFD